VKTLDKNGVSLLLTDVTYYSTHSELFLFESAKVRRLFKTTKNILALAGRQGMVDGFVSSVFLHCGHFAAGT
jgi:hypothetical protein